MQQMLLLLLILIGYLCGSIPSGKLLGLLRGIDIQKHGSGNIGFANAVRVLGWPLGLAVLTFDILKGALPVYLALPFLTRHELFLIAAAAVLGHIFPIWLRFHGGKGVATGLGVLVVLNPLIALLGFSCYCLVFALSRTSGLASVAASWSLLISTLLFDHTLFGFCGLLAIIGTYTHRHNLQVFFKSLRKTKA